MSLVAGAALLLPALVMAQPSAHYVPGAEGIKGATLPPPGIYLRDYNIAYYSTRLNDAKGRGIGGLDSKAFVFATVPRLIWITDLQVLGGYLGVDALIPFKYTELRMGGLKEHTFGPGDVFFEATWSRHFEKFDLSAGYGVWAPTGDFSDTDPTRAGSGFWTHMLTAGATWYPDQEKLWSLSALNRYEINQEQRSTDITPGQVYTLEWGVSRALSKTVDLGLVGYYQQKVTHDQDFDAFPKARVSALGPEISVAYPRVMLFWSLRYVYEFMAEDRLKGQTATLTITKRF